MFVKPSALLVPIVLLVVPGCGHWPPVLYTKGDIAGLPASEPSVRARFLADRDIPSLARLKELRDLDFSSGNKKGPAKITDEGLAELAKLDLPRLETLTLGWCDNITDAGLAHIGRMQTITWLGLTDCANITDAGLRELVKTKNLTGLDLRGCHNITDNGIQQLAAKANWTRIELGGCPKITPQGVAKLQAALPNARVVKDEEEWEAEAPHSRSWRNR
jgi:hypothetical protein